MRRGKGAQPHSRANIKLLARPLLSSRAHVLHIGQVRFSFNSLAGNDPCLSPWRAVLQGNRTALLLPPLLLKKEVSKKDLKMCRGFRPLAKERQRANKCGLWQFNGKMSISLAQDCVLTVTWGYTESHCGIQSFWKWLHLQLCLSQFVLVLLLIYVFSFLCFFHIAVKSQAPSLPS